MEHDTRGVHISAGDGIVAHVANLTAHATGEEGRLNELLVRLNALAGEPWQETVRTLTAGIAEAGYDNHPAIACVSVEKDKVAALVFGDATLTVTIDGAETVLDGRDSSTWIDVALRGTVERVHAGQQSDSTVVGVLRDGVIPAGGFLLDTSGPIPASGSWSEAVGTSMADEPAESPALDEAAPEASDTDSSEVAETFPTITTAEDSNDAAALDTEEATVEQSQPPAEQPSIAGSANSHSMFARIEEIGRVASSLDESESVGDAAPTEPASASESPFGESPFAEGPVHDGDANPATAASQESIPQATLAPQRPQLKGVLCPVGHLTAPTETECRTCGETVAVDAATATGDRPVLGTITFDDGAVLNVDRPAAIGSDVPAGYAIDGEPATIVRLDDGVDGVADIQVEVRMSGWNVEIVDMNSESGTYTMLRGERQTRTKLRANQSVVLQPEMEVQAGGRSFVFNTAANNS